MPCRTHAPQLVEKYKKLIAPKSTVEMIHASVDFELEETEAWARKGLFPWPTVIMDDHAKAGLEQFAGQFIPHTVLIDKNGKIITSSEREAFKNIAEL